MEVFANMKPNGLNHNATTFALIIACSKGNETKKTLEVYGDTKQNGLKPKVITYYALVSARAKGEQTRKPSGLQPDVITFILPSSLLEGQPERRPGESWRTRNRVA